MALKTKLKAIADAIRAKGGTTDNLSLDGMVTAIEAIPSGGEDTAVALIERTITEADYPTVTKVGLAAFSNCYSLTTINLPKCTTVDQNAFQYCSALTSIDLPVCTSIENYAFDGCSSLTSVNLPACTDVSNYVFYNCSSLTTVNLPACQCIYTYAFYNCSSLTSIDLPISCFKIRGYAFADCVALTTVILRRKSKAAALEDSNAFDGTSSSLCIYVPDALVDSYKTATNWSVYADKIKPLSELPTEA